MIQNQEYMVIVLWILAFSALGLTTIEQVLYLSNDPQWLAFIGFEVFLWMGVVGDILITIFAFIVRYQLIDPEKFTDAILETDISNKTGQLEGRQLNPSRYLNWMPLAMIVGTAATAVIQLNFYIGMLVYLINQLSMIIAFSGIIHIDRETLLHSPIKNKLFLSFIGWIVIASLIVLTLILPGWGILTLVLIPYICALITMALFTFFAFFYDQRPLKFRLGLCLGACFFVFSDSLIGYSAVNPFYLAPVFIRPTYKLAVFCLQTAILFYRKKNGDLIWR